MPEVVEVVVVTGESAIATAVPASSLEVEVHLENTATVGSISDISSIEVTLPGVLTVPNGSVVYNVGNAYGLLVLATGAPVPPGTPAGTVILRT